MSSAVQAALMAVFAQVATLAVGYGVVSNAQVGQWAALSMAIVNAAALLAHAIHAHGRLTGPAAFAIPSDTVELASVPPEAAPDTAVKPDLQGPA